LLSVHQRGQDLCEIFAVFFAACHWLPIVASKPFVLGYSIFSGVGAYPSSTDKHRIVELKTGKVLKAADVFKRESLETIAATVNRAMQAEIRRAIAKADPDAKSVIAELTAQRFQIQNLNDFSVSDRGVTFLYDFGFPHVAKALEPPGRYFLSYKQLKPYIKQDGALGLFLKNQM
jgi:hypothetical protein